MKYIFNFAALVCLFAVSCGLAQGQGGAKRVRRQPVARGDFNRLAAQAAAAREAQQIDEAITVYRQALRLRPGWDEGWWYLATLLYDRDSYAEAARAFKETARLRPKAGAPLAMLGLCEFQLGAYDEALAHIRQGRQVGLIDNKELTRALRYHEGILLIIKGQFEQAEKTLGTLSAEGVGTENLIIGLGLAILRLPVLPRTITPHSKDHDLVRRAGWAEHLMLLKNFADAQIEYERLVTDYPKTPNVQYAYGRYQMAQRNEDAAVKAFEREIENSPKHAFARLQIAYLRLNIKDPAAGLKYAEEAVKLYPNFPLGYYVLGRLLFDTGANDRAIEALETAGKLSPDDAKVYFALARAYTRAKRKTDADRARETFARLNQQAENASQQSFGIDESPKGNP
ncbi:MAG: tetratricopeptide repeat protein [Pyrinomonadaceae bacterium]